MLKGLLSHWDSLSGIFSRIISPSISFLESTISCDVRDWTAMDCEWKPWVVSFTFSSTFTSSSTWKCLDELQVDSTGRTRHLWYTCGFFAFPRWKCVDPKPECTSWSSTCRFSQLNFDCKAESRCEIRSACSIILIWRMFSPHEKSVGFKSERMQLIWVSFTSEYLQVDVVHLSANEIRCPSQQPLFYSWQLHSHAKICRPLFSSKMCCSFRMFIHFSSCRWAWVTIVLGRVSSCCSVPKL